MANPANPTPPGTEFTGSIDPKPHPNQASQFIQLEQLQNPGSGEGTYHCLNHTLFISLAPRPVPYVQVQDGKTHTGVYQQGEMLITPAHTPLLVQWEGDENCLQIQLKPEFLQKIARETLDPKEQHLELVSAFQQQDAQLGAIGQMLLREWHQEFSNGQLYLDSLTNILAVNLLRHNLSYHQSTILQLPTYDGGLPQQQLKQVLDYVHGHLDQEIKLETLACLLDMSQFHFSRLFKQSLGISPHQYLLQQRVEQAKQLLKHTDRLIVDIALDCGFNSHSHLSRQFRQLTGVTPKAYRAS